MFFIIIFLSILLRMKECARSIETVGFVLLTRRLFQYKQSRNYYAQQYSSSAKA